MMIGNPFATATQGVPGNTSTPAPPAPAPSGSRQDTRDGQQPRSGMTPDDNNQQNNNQEEIDPATGKPKVKDGKDELGVDLQSLWENDPVDPNAPKDQDTGYLPKIDPAQLQATIGKMDFTKGIKPEQLQAITAGGEGATQAVLQIVNQAGQQNALTMFSAASKMIEQALTTAESRFAARMPGQVRDTLASTNLSESNLAAKDPRFGHLVESVRNRISDKYPKLNAKQVEFYVNKHFADLRDTLTPKSKTKTPEEEEVVNDNLLKKGDPTADWQQWFDGPDASKQ